MNSKFLSYYSKELSFLKEMGQEFAQKYPKVGSRLALNASDIPDPYIERLLEGVAFLTARTQLKLNAEYPRFVQRILEVVYPDFLTPKPTAAVVRVQPIQHYHADTLYQINRGHVLRSMPIDEYQMSCPFSVCQNAEITPLYLEKAQYTDVLSYLPNLNQLTPKQGKPIQSALRLDFSLTVPTACSDMLPENLRLHLSGELSKSSALLYLLAFACEAVVCHASDNPKAWCYPLSNQPEQQGFSDDEALTFHLNKTVSAFRLLQEYAQLPEKFLFIAQKGIKQALMRAEHEGHLPKQAQQTEAIVDDKGSNKKIITYQKRRFSLSFLFNTTQSEWIGLVQAADFSLNALTVVNLFKQKGVRFPINTQNNEHHVVIDRTQPLNYEVHTIEQLKGFDQHNRPVTTFVPMYHSPDTGLFPNTHHDKAYFSARRENRLPSTEIKRSGFRSSYLGSEVFVSLATPQDYALNSEIHHLAVEAWCTSRDLPLLIPREGVSDFLLEGALPIQSIKFISKPSRPQAAPDEDDNLWSFLNQLGLNYLSLSTQERQTSVLQLKKLLSVFVPANDDFLQKQIDAIVQVRTESIRKLVRHQGGAASVRGIKLTVVLDEILLGGIHPFLFGSLLNHYFNRLVSLNAFVQLQLETIQQGQIACWAVQLGARKLI
ncbi:MAG: type VI secretion system baseplate subunit TssF [Alysiella sp.]|uniref:type VI secretion system baseplate subunit TssF n=1 Tax=Alysiella sp. TaxID=1872483 RepID=UPI0026DAA1D6|nr:type VI secretion system baseplate subunit TssF [Alysiella sp.]MDO4433988.1 type VI secretion system baseplate subunit TssF [Alysiella sp.]